MYFAEYGEGSLPIELHCIKTFNYLKGTVS